MRSPRFTLREPTLRPLFDRGNLRRIWEKKVRHAMRQQFLPDPIDHLDFHHNLSDHCSHLERLVISGNYSPGATRRILQEKSKGLCRQLVIPSVRDAIVLQTLSDAMYRDIKNKAPTDRAFFEPSDHHFSNSKKMFERSEYGSFRAWLNFQQEIFKFSENREYVVVTDVANYYDTISYQHLRNVISDISPSVRESVLDMLIFVLSGILWQPDYAPRIEIGLPQMNLDAPRILAHCFLYELDAYLSKTSGNDFVRFMDDIDIGVDSLADARSVLKSIDLVLQTRHVRLNSGKTLILTKAAAVLHFRIRQNVVLDWIEGRIDSRVSRGQSMTTVRTRLVKTISRMWQSGQFDAGNGEKILKRLLGIARRIGAKVEDRFLYEILLRRPAVRVAALGVISSVPLTNQRARLLLTVVRDPQIVDDATHLNIAQSIVDTRVPSGRGVSTLILAMAASMPSGFFGLYGRLWILSKYGTQAEVLNLVQDSREQWASDPWLGRLVGGLYPIFIRSRSEADFRRLVLGSDCPDAIKVFEFHDDLRRSQKAFEMAFKFLRAPNSSKATGISHAKFLLLVSALANRDAPKLKVQQLIDVHARVWSDGFYQRRAARASVLPVPVTVGPATPVP